MSHARDLLPRIVAFASYLQRCHPIAWVLLLALEVTLVILAIEDHEWVDVVLDGACALFLLAGYWPRVEAGSGH